MEPQTVEPIPVELAYRSATPLQRYFSRASHKPEPIHGEVPAPDSDLLKAIRSALRGDNAHSSSSSTSQLYPVSETGSEEEELSWDTYNVVLGSGGVIRKKWNFEEDGQPIQWACIGWFEQPASVSSPSARSGAYTSEDQDYQEISLQDPNERPTFGPFARVAAELKTESEPAGRQRAVFVFLRSIGRVFFMNGLEHTFYLPFLVRKAWAMAPHGIMMQRVLEPGELDEAIASGDEPLPTLFTMVNPFAEASTVGLTQHIDRDLPSILVEFKVDPEKQIDTMPAHEHVLWASHPTADTVERIMVTLNNSAKTLTVWRYCYVHPRLLPQPIPQPSAHTNTKPRNSLSSPISPRQVSFNTSVVEHPPLASLPGAPPALITTTMASIVPGSIPNAPVTPAPAKGTAWNEHPVNLDKATVGGRVDSAPFIDPVDHVRMKPSFWMAKLFSETISDAE